MFIVQKHKSESRQIDSHDLQFMVVSNLSDLVQAEVYSADAIVLSDMPRDEACQIMTDLRRSNEKNLYLKPVFVVDNQLGIDDLGCDGKTDLAEFEDVALKTKSILSRIRKVNTTFIPNDFERHGIFKLLAYLYTRGTTLQPVASRHSKFGYAFPFVDQLFSDKSVFDGLQLLKRSYELGVTSSKLVDKIHNCPSCHGNYINFREVCPKCSGLSIESKDLVHHFKCAHVDVIDNFKTEDGLHCHKCDHKLRHIGVDYDKPSSMYQCHDCHHAFQDTEMRAYCIDCGHEDDTNNLLENDIESYAITAKGEHIVENGWSLPHTQTVKEGQHLAPDLFKMMLKMEVKRSLNHHHTSTFASIYFSEAITNHLGRDQQTLFQNEIVEIIGSYLDTSDLITSTSPKEYLLLMHDKTTEVALEALQLIEHNLLKLVADNILSDENLIATNCQAITPEFNSNDVF